jgi:hypothetical protein
MLSRLTVETVVDHRSQRPNFLHSRIVIEKGAPAPQSGFLTIKMLRDVRYWVDMRRGAVGHRSTIS